MIISPIASLFRLHLSHRLSDCNHSLSPSFSLIFSAISYSIPSLALKLLSAIDDFLLQAKSKEKEIWVTNTPDVLIDDVADLALATLRRICKSNRYVRSCSCKKGDFKLTTKRMENATETFQPRPFSIKLWPPSQSTRLMLVERMTNNLSTPSIFSKKYGLLRTEEAVENSKQIEEEAFVVANEHYEREPDGDGSSAVQLYAKHSNKLMRPLAEQGNSYSKICFSNRSFGIGAAHVVEPILVSLKDQLTEVDLSDFIAGRPEAEALEVMNMFQIFLKQAQHSSSMPGRFHPDIF